ncbi:hypothetical protein DDZ18_04820 [Marinicauda salina]|uniref:UrcA family protein n=2 Tax=Marinicauda salina TaxID=2135793 RepID=A0A2U2BV74_9PROT|nr:hypothetical protein DDZ18_04820 [Marinicauda salina]
MESEMFWKKFLLACPVAVVSLTFSAVQAEDIVGKAAEVEVEVMDARGATLARLHQRVTRFCDLNQVAAGLTERRAAAACRADLINELTVKPGDVQLIGGAPRFVPAARTTIVAALKPAS